jgi:hypothetical protein
MHPYDKERELEKPVNGPFYGRMRCLRHIAERLAGTTHWKLGHSARALILSWTRARGFPQEVKAVLEKQFSGLDLLWAFVEYPTGIKGKGGMSKTDIVAIAASDKGPVVIAVEGKADSDNFGKSCLEWVRAGKDKDNSELRLEECARALGVEKQKLNGVCSQLVYRAASAVIVAEKLRTNNAVMLVHAFELTGTHFGDFENFARALGTEQPQKICLVRASAAGSVRLWLGWVDGDRRFLR